MGIIRSVSALQILDSRGFPTVEVEITNEQGLKARASVPSGASTGVHEAVELRDGGQRFAGKGVSRAVHNVEQIIAPEICGKSVFNQRELDDLLINLDGTNNKSNLGANAILGVSLCLARLAAKSKNLDLYAYLAEYLYEPVSQGNSAGKLLPMPMINVINGGVHADNSMDIQEFMLVPVNCDSFSMAMEQSLAVFYTLKRLLKSKGYTTNVGDEGGFAPALSSNEQAIELLLEAILQAGFIAGKDFMLALDAASSEMYDCQQGQYRFYKSDPNKYLSSEKMVDFWLSLVKQYPIFSIEDPMAEDDWEGWQGLSAAMPKQIQLVGDDLFVTNKARLELGISRRVANSILVKINQIGTISETLATVQYAQAKGYTTIMSHRSGESEDSSIADLAVAFNCGQIKTGGLSRTDRMAKYNQLLRIEKLLGRDAKMAQLKDLAIK